MKLNFTLITALILSISGAYPSTLSAEKSKIQKAEPVKKSTKRSYKKCRQGAVVKIRRVKDKKIHGKLLKEAVARCREQHPAAAVLIDCKKEAVRAYGSNREYLPTALKECKDKYTDFKFQTSNSSPLKVIDNEAFFAGVGLNKNRRIYDLKKKKNKRATNQIGNFDCENLQETMTKAQKPSYLLFGNDPRTYLALKQQNKTTLIQTLGINANKASDTIEHPYLGQVHWQRSLRYITNFFPSASCTYAGKDMGIYESIQVYYLIDQQKKIATPYFGIAFYKEKTRIPLAQLLEEVKTLLGEGYVTSKSKSGLDLIAKTEIQHFDHEGDPRNLCQFPRKHDFLAAISSSATKGQKDYLVVSNIGNLCKYGDRFGSRFLKHGFKK